MSEFDDFRPSGSWHPRPRSLLGLVLVVAGGMGAIVFGATEWLKYEWENAPTHYADGRVEYPDGRVVHPDGRVERRDWSDGSKDGR